MPGEPPEVETIRGAARTATRGEDVARVEILDPRLTRPHDLFEVMEEPKETAWAPVERRGKYLLLRLESGSACSSTCA